MSELIKRLHFIFAWLMFAWKCILYMHPTQHLLLCTENPEQVKGDYYLYIFIMYYFLAKKRWISWREKARKIETQSKNPNTTTNNCKQNTKPKKHTRNYKPNTKTLNPKPKTRKPQNQNPKPPNTKPKTHETKIPNQTQNPRHTKPKPQTPKHETPKRTWSVAREISQKQVQSLNKWVVIWENGLKA